jgi:hypothetical protein
MMLWVMRRGPFWFERYWLRYHHHWAAVLVVDDVTIYLKPWEHTHMAVTLSVGHKLNLAIAFLDQHGNPLLTPPTPDAKPTWTDTTPATETLAVDASGLTATGTPIAAGTDTISLSLLVGGKPFTATLDVTVTPEAQVLTSIDIVPTVV